MVETQGAKKTREAWETNAKMADANRASPATAGRVSGLETLVLQDDTVEKGKTQRTERLACWGQWRPAARQPEPSPRDGRGPGLCPAGAQEAGVDTTRLLMTSTWKSHVASLHSFLWSKASD